MAAARSARPVSPGTAQLDDASDPQPTFVADLEGTYIAQLIVFDGLALSAADTVAITTNANLPPRIIRGPDRVASIGTPATLDAVATDPNLDPLTFSWALLSRPTGSAAALSATAGPSVQITPDAGGDYIVQLVVMDLGGFVVTETLLLTTSNTAPTGVAGADRDVATGQRSTSSWSRATLTTALWVTSGASSRSQRGGTRRSTRHPLKRRRSRPMSTACTSCR